LKFDFFGRFSGAKKGPLKAKYSKVQLAAHGTLLVLSPGARVVRLWWAKFCFLSEFGFEQTGKIKDRVPGLKSLGP